MKHHKRPHHHLISRHDMWALVILLIVAIVAAVILLYPNDSGPRVPPAIPLVILPVAKPAPVAPKPAASVPVAAPAFPRVKFQVIVPSIATGTATITDASPAVFAYAHGTAGLGDKFVIGMANRAGNTLIANKLLFFTDSQFLNRYLTVLLPHGGDIETMVYDPVTAKVYFLLTGNGDLELYSFDPSTLFLRAVASSTSIDAGGKPAIVSDGTYVYGITDTVPSTVFKVRLSDGAITSSSHGHISHGHSAAIGIYPDSEELYFGGGLSDGFEKADASTLSALDRIDVSPCSETDDMPYRKVDDTTGYVYVGCEFQPYGYRIRTSDLSATRFLLPGSSLGVFIFGNSLYNAAQDGNVDVFPGFDLGMLDRYHIASSSLVDDHNQDLEPNELFYAPATNDLYFTAWYGTPGLYRISTSTDK